MAKNDVRLKAEAYYIENVEATNKEVAELFKITEKTLGTWVTKYNWEEKRWDFNASPTFIKQKPTTGSSAGRQWRKTIFLR